MSTDERLYRSPSDDTELRNAVCDWLRANSIDPGLVPADERPDCSYRDGEGTPLGGHTITTRVRVTVAPESRSTTVRFGSNRVEETTITRKMRVPPPPLVQAWLIARCPMCDR